MIVESCIIEVSVLESKCILDHSGGLPASFVDRCLSSVSPRYKTSPSRNHEEHWERSPPATHQLTVTPEKEIEKWSNYLVIYHDFWSYFQQDSFLTFHDFSNSCGRLLGTFCLKRSVSQTIHTVSWLVVSTPLNNMEANGKDDIPYIIWKKHVWNHQPGIPSIAT